MPRLIRKPIFAHRPVRIVSAALVVAIAGFSAGSAASTTREVVLATPDQALAYCQSGKMPSGDIAYVAGGPGLVQYGPDQSCAQQVASKIRVTKAIKAVGNRVGECRLAGATTAIPFCQSGTMGEWDIDYIAGKVGKTLSGPGYGCVVNFSTSSIGTAVCR
ncbi:MAG TPA: hypothetical protein VHT03_07095 [Rhizomicrobium sp.]|jgi:hypothetical protein|nr:hypothetical protein [Rhizomicrobium sp.]